MLRSIGKIFEKMDEVNSIRKSLQYFYDDSKLYVDNFTMTQVFFFFLKFIFFISLRIPNYMGPYIDHNKERAKRERRDKILEDIDKVNSKISMNKLANSPRNKNSYFKPLFLLRNY
jgi:Ca2+-binding EF-hand superfamily protein